MEPWPSNKKQKRRQHELLFAFICVHSRPILPFLGRTPRIYTNNVDTVYPSNSQEHCNR
jgi:hypothetical protein